MNVGIDLISFQTAQYFLDLRTLAQTRGVDPEKYYQGLGQEKMAVPPPDVPSVMPPTAVLPLRDTVTPVLVMTAVSAEPGTAFEFQLAAVFQKPLAVLVQMKVAARVETAPASRRVRAANRAEVRVVVLIFIGFCPLRVGRDARAGLQAGSARSLRCVPL